MRLLSWDCWQRERQHQLAAFLVGFPYTVPRAVWIFFQCSLSGVYGGDLEEIWQVANVNAKWLIRCQCLTTLWIAYITCVWSVIPPYFFLSHTLHLLPSRLNMEWEGEKQLHLLLATNQCGDQRSSFLMPSLFICRWHTPKRTTGHLSQ